MTMALADLFEDPDVLEALNNIESAPPWLLEEMTRVVYEFERRGLEERYDIWQPCGPPYNDQLGFLTSTALVRLLGGGNRTGKTETGVKDAIDVAIGKHPVRTRQHPPPVKLRYCGTTFEDGVSIILNKFRQMVPRRYLLGHSWESAWSEGKKTLTFALDGRKHTRGSVIRFKSATQALNTYGGEDLDGCYMDEHFQQAYYIENMARLVDRGGYMVMTMTPEAGLSWEEGEILLRAQQGDPNYSVWFFDTRLNPHISKEGLEQLIRSLEGNPQLFKAKIRGLFVALEGLVYPMFNEDVHVMQDDWDLLDTAVHFTTVLDPHLNKAWATGWYAWFRNGDVIKFQEDSWRKFEDGCEGYARRFRSKSFGLPLDDYIIDEALGGTPKEEQINAFGQKSFITQLNELKLPFIGTNLATDKSVRKGILEVIDHLKRDPISGRPRYRIFQSCQKTIREYRIYQYKKRTPIDEESYRERIRNIDDDHVTCDRYALVSKPHLGPRGPITPVTVEWDPESGRPVYVEGYTRRQYDNGISAIDLGLDD